MKETQKGSRLSIEPNGMLWLLVPPLVTPFIVAFSTLSLGIGGVFLLAAVVTGGISPASFLIYGVLMLIGWAALETFSAYLSYFAPPLLFGVTFVCWYLLSLVEWTTGRTVFFEGLEDWMKVPLRPLLFVSMISVGLTTVMMISLLAFTGFFDPAQQLTTEAFHQTVGGLWKEVRIELQTIANHARDWVTFVFGAICTICIFMVLFGVNALIAKSVIYCINIHITAFLIDLTATVLFHLLLAESLQQSLANSASQFDKRLRETSLAPLEWLSKLSKPTQSVFDAFAGIFEHLSLLLAKLLSLTIQTVFVAENGFRRSLIEFLAYAETLRVDFLIFVGTSIVYGVLLFRKNPDEN